MSWTPDQVSALVDYICDEKHHAALKSDKTRYQVLEKHVKLEDGSNLGFTSSQIKEKVHRLRKGVGDENQRLDAAMDTIVGSKQRAKRKAKEKAEDSLSRARNALDATDSDEEFENSPKRAKKEPYTPKPVVPEFLPKHEKHEDSPEEKKELSQDEELDDEHQSFAVLEPEKPRFGRLTSSTAPKITTYRGIDLEAMSGDWTMPAILESDDGKKRKYIFRRLLSAKNLKLQHEWEVRHGDKKKAGSKNQIAIKYYAAGIPLENQPDEYQASVAMIKQTSKAVNEAAWEQTFDLADDDIALKSYVTEEVTDATLEYTFNIKAISKKEAPVGEEESKKSN